MTLRPNVERLRTHPAAVMRAENDLRLAADCLRSFRGAVDMSVAVHWLVEAERYTTQAWQRLDEGGAL